MENIYKKMWNKFKKKYGNEYIIFEGGDDVKDVMNEFEEKYLDKLPKADPEDDDILEIGYDFPKIYIPFTKIRIL